MSIGIIGGSGWDQLEGVQHRRERVMTTPFGEPSAPFTVGEIHGAEFVFLLRHGRGHTLMPSEINHRANLYAMKQLGVTTLLSVAAVGSFHEELAPGDIVLVDQFFDRTKSSAEHTFFGDGIVGHIAFSQPVCARLNRELYGVIDQILARGKHGRARVHPRGTYLNMEGPAFSTMAESKTYRAWGMDVIGMTNVAEAKLAREAEICYQTIAMVTDYDCLHEVHGPVSVEMIIETLRRNVALGQEIVRAAVPRLQALEPVDCPCRSALKNAIITNPAMITPAIRTRLAPIIGKYLP